MISVTQVKSNRNALTPLQTIDRFRKALGSVTGLTFIEIFLVILIIGALVAISFPNLKSSFNNIQLNSFSQELLGYMNYLRERSIVEQKIIFLTVDIDNREYWAKIKDGQERLKTHAIPPDMQIEFVKLNNPQDSQIIFYPDGSIDNVTIAVANLDNQKITLTTKGVFGGVKLLPQE